MAIVGGGFSGAAVALHLGRLAPNAVRITIIEPRKEIGRGVAFGTTDQSHRINVPAFRMLIFPEDPKHFERWYATSPYRAADPDAEISTGRLFPLRSVFGTYVGEQIAQLGPALSHLRTKAVRIERLADGYRVVCANGRTVDASVVVLAICHPPPAYPGVLRRFAVKRRFVIPDPWKIKAFKDVAADASILIIGTGLTMADIAASLERQKHHGQIVAISRRGQLSRGHAATAVDPLGDFLATPAKTARDLVKRVRKAVAEAAQDGQSWHGVLDQVRIQASRIWRALPINEQRRLARHIRPFWDSHRFRVAPQVQQVLDRKRSSGQLAVHAASLQDVKQIDGRLQITLRHRRRGRREQMMIDRIAVATGPAHGNLFTSDRLLSNMKQSGLAHDDPLDFGIEVDGMGRAINQTATAEQNLFVASPLARGMFGELVGVPDLSYHAQNIATAIAELLQLGHHRTAEQQK